MADVDGAVVSSLAPSSGDSGFEYIAVNGSAVNLGPTPLVLPETDTTVPIVTNFSPPAGNAITSATIIEFDVTDETGLAAIIVMASFPDGTLDVVHDGLGFRTRYVGDVNARAPIANGFHYVTRRVGGWPGSPTFEFFPVDTSGNLGEVA
jgi:hypothetical protein